MGAHVGPHEPAHPTHGQQGGDDGQGREDGRVAHLVHGADRLGDGRLALLQPMAEDVLHHHRGVVHQDADGKDEGEQAHPVDGVVHHHGPPDGEHDHHRDHGDDHEGGPRPHAHQAQDGDDDGRLEHGLEKLVDLVVGGLAVVAGHLDMDVGGNQGALQGLQLLQDGLGDGDAVGLFLLGDGEGHRLLPIGLVWALIGRTRRVGRDPHRVLGDVLHVGHVAHVDGTPALGAHHQACHVLRRAQEGPGIDVEGGTARLRGAGRQLGVGALDGVGNAVQGDAVSCQALHLHLDPDLVGASADHEALSGVRDRAQPLQDVQGQGAELGVRHLRGPEGEGHHRDVVHAYGPHQGHAHVRRHLVHVGLELVVDLDDGLTHVLAHIEAHRHHRRPPLGRRVGVLHPGDLHHDPLQGLGDQALHLLRRGPGVLDEDVDHRHRDLGVLLSGREEKPHQPQAHARHEEHGRDRGVDE